VLDEAVLIEALQSNRLGAAVLDVTAQEPLPVDHPLWRCPNVLLTQHTAGGSAIELHNKIKVFTENFARYVAGEPLENVVDWQRGY